MAHVPALRREYFPRDFRDPFRAIAKMQREMDQIFEQFMTSEPSALGAIPADISFQPLCDIEEKDSHYLLSLDVPGLRKEDLKIELKDGELHVYGEKKEEKDESHRGRQRSERYYGSVERWITLPSNVKAEGAEAKLDHGVLQIAIPKGPEVKGSQIKIGDGTSGIFAPSIEQKSAA